MKIPNLKDGYRLPTTPRCPNNACGRTLAGAVAANKHDRQTAKPGDISICVYCGELATFDDDMHMRALTAYDRMMAPPEVWEAYALMARKRKGTSQ